MPLTTDLDHGGRWTSLVLGGREWLWQRPDPDRFSVAAGHPFVDVGGLEECVPTVRGTPDHGDAWSRPWRRLAEDRATVTCAEFALVRTLHCDDDRVVASYELSAEPGYRFIWAAHALLELSDAAVLRLPHVGPVRVFAEAAPLVNVPWPSGAPYLTGPWPRPFGLPLEELGRADGTEVGAVAVDCAEAVVLDGSTALRMRLRAVGSPTSLALWRNLGGFPDSGPYRSIGIEPMLGRVFDLADATDDEDAVTVPTSGSVSWRLEIEACPRL